MKHTGKEVYNNLSKRILWSTFSKAQLKFKKHE